MALPGLKAWQARRSAAQAARWETYREEARAALGDVPEPIRPGVGRALETVLDGPEAELSRALDELDRLLAPHPELYQRFFRLRVVDDAVESQK